MEHARYVIVRAIEIWRHASKYGILGERVEGMEEKWEGRSGKGRGQAFELHALARRGFGTHARLPASIEQL